jgi:pimeloyl-ACP methyl ester carboxylesterase
VDEGYDKAPRNPDAEYVRYKAKEIFYDRKFVSEDLIAWVLEILKSNRNKLRLLKVAHSSKRLNMADHLPKIKAPTLLVWGKQDQITPPEAGQTFAEKMPNARLLFIDKCGHAPNIEKPDELNAAAEDFLKEIGY